MSALSLKTFQSVSLETLPRSINTRSNHIAAHTKTHLILALAFLPPLNSDNQTIFDNLGYLPHVEDSVSVEVRETPHYGRAIFATHSIQKGATIAAFRGPSYFVDRETDLDPVMVDHTIQIGPKEHLHGYRGLAELANHACGQAANCGIKNSTQITALRDIAPGEEIRWDYRRSEDSDWYLDGECKCGSPDCTRIVGPFRELPPQMKQSYFEDGFTSQWILDFYNKNTHDY